MKTHISIHKKSAQKAVMIIAMLLSAILFPLTTMADTAHVTNSVSVSSDGNGSVQTKTKTIINGVVVEDSTTNEAGTRTSVITQNGVTTSVATNVGEAHGRDAELLMLIEKLKLLIQYYVSLLNTK